MDTRRYLDCLSADFALFRAAASAADPAAQVPSCPDWTMSDLAYHLAEVYLHKVVTMRTGEWPEKWPPEELAAEPVLALLDRAYTELIETFAELPPGTFAPTFMPGDQRVGWWLRRMAQETVIHRIDAQQAAGLPVTAVPDDLALDGVDEILTCFLGRLGEGLAEVKLAHLAAPGGGDTIQLSAGPATWTISPGIDKIAVTDGPAAAPHVTLTAGPDPMLRWLWGRAPDAEVRIAGDPAWSAALRQMLIANTQ